MTKSNHKLIHVGCFQSKGEGTSYLYLRRMDPHILTWFERMKNGEEKETSISGHNVEESMRLAHRNWKDQFFRPLRCGFKYTLPERDEHGINALFHHMAASYSSPNGVFFDEELGNNCFVNFASQEALAFWRKLKQENIL